MASVTIKVDGLRELGERMRNLSAKTANQFSYRATGKSASLVKKEAKRNIQKSPSIVTRSLLNAVIAKKIPKSKTALTAEHIVTVRRKRTGRKTKTLQQTAPHAHFVEFGVPSRNIPAEPFLRPALDQNIQPCINIMKDSLAKDILKAGQ